MELPADRSLPNIRSFDTGKLRDSKQFRISLPTAPVAPTIPTVKDDNDIVNDEFLRTNDLCVALLEKAFTNFVMS
jgi:hypothetical protein